MSSDARIEPTVKSARTLQPRMGRGFSIDEVNQVGLPLKAARTMGLIVDLRRKTSHEDNIEILKQFMKKAGKPASAKVTVSAPKVDSDAAIAELVTIRAVKKADAVKLVKAGVKSLSELAYCDVAKVSKKTGIEEDRLTAMVKAALKKA
jgi:hypothetical protein